jgi:signal transduction histidine kinase
MEPWFPDGARPASDLRPVPTGHPAPISCASLLSSSTMIDAQTTADERRAEIQAALDAAVRGIAALASVDEVFQVIVDRVRPLVGAQYAALGIVDAGGRIERFITSGMDVQTRRRIGDLPEGRGLLGLIIHENRTFRIRDLNIDPRRSGFPPNHPPMTSFLGVPITVKGVSLGRLYLTNKIGGAEFSADDQSLVETFALHAGIAMENARLHEQLKRLAIVDERDRISKDLHDGIIQNMYAVSLSLEDVPELMDEDQPEAAARVERAIDAIHLSIQDIRNFIFGLRPELLEGTTLVAGLAALIEEYRHNTMIDLELVIPETVDEPASEETSHVLAIVGETLSNVVRHSHATRATVTVGPWPAEGLGLEVRIEDNGTGFDPATAARLGHQGLANVRDRAAVIGGAIEIDSRPGSGTRIIVHVPAPAGVRGETE